MPDESVDGPERGIPTPARHWAAGAIWCAMAMSVLGSSTVTVAMPSLAHDVGRTPAEAIRIITYYQLAILVALLPCGRAGERFGYRRVFLCGVVVFMAGSLASAIAPGFTGLVVARFVQGLGAACTMAVNGALLRMVYPSRLLGRGTGYNAVVTAMSATAGPSIASLVLLYGSWRWLFLLNLPLSVAALAIGARFLPRDAGDDAGLDAVSVVLSAVMMGGVFMGTSGLLEWRSAPATVLPLLAGLAAAVPLFRRVRGQEAPLVPLDLLRLPKLRLSYATSSCSFAAMMLVGISLPFVIVGHYGFDEHRMGLLITPLPLGIALAAPLSGRLVERFSAGVLGGLGLIVFATGLAVLALLPADPSVVAVVAGMALAGGGFGLFQAPNNRTMISEAPAARAGAAGSLIALARLAGQTAGALVAARALDLAGAKSSAPLWIAVAAALAASLVSFRRTNA